jgi:1,4-dihydroxy-2-naphthoyl-CoA synthase
MSIRNTNTGLVRHCARHPCPHGLTGMTGMTEDSAESRAAFLGKRKPSFRYR